MVGGGAGAFPIGRCSLRLCFFSVCAGLPVSSFFALFLFCPVGGIPESGQNEVVSKTAFVIPRLRAPKNFQGKQNLSSRLTKHVEKTNALIWGVARFLNII